MTDTYQSAADTARAIVAHVGTNIVLGLPIGIGKATHIADALFDLANSDASISLTIFTGLTLEAPAGSSDLERRLVDPLAARLYPDWPVPRYARAVRERKLPDNIRVQEFYLRPGAYLRDDYVQQHYSSINYSQVADELMRLGVNVVAQLMAVSGERSGRVSLGANPEVTLDLLPYFAQRRAAGLPSLLVGQVNRQMPYMLGDADLDAADVDILLDDSSCDHALFPLPNRRVSDGDYATAMHVASLVRDGGSLQVGIGSLSDAVAHCLTVRHTQPEIFADVLQQLPGGSATTRRKELPIELAPFRQGLFSSTELLSDALFSLFTAGILSRAADQHDSAVMHAGFFIGSNALYQGLRALPDEQRRRINMTAISNVNTLFGDESRKRRQRNHARFINETMMVTLLGAAVSDALEDGRVVSGVGGQFDFVSMAQSLQNAMSILMCRARREHDGRVSSNIRWNYGHITVPRHHRDIYVTEYGIAATRGCGDRDVIDRMLHIADAEFHDELAKAAVAAGKLKPDYAFAADAQHNQPATITSVFERFREVFPPYPLGSELSAEEQALIEALGWLQTSTRTPARMGMTVLRAVAESSNDANLDAIERMSLTAPRNIKERIARALLNHALNRTRL